jgi:hypothetical protein
MRFEAGWHGVEATIEAIRRALRDLPLADGDPLAHIWPVEDPARHLPSPRRMKRSTSRLRDRGRIGAASAFTAHGREGA